MSTFSSSSPPHFFLQLLQMTPQPLVFAYRPFALSIRPRHQSQHLLEHRCLPVLYLWMEVGVVTSAAHTCCLPLRLPQRIPFRALLQAQVYCFETKSATLGAFMRQISRWTWLSLFLLRIPLTLLHRRRPPLLPPLHCTNQRSVLMMPINEEMHS